MTPIGRWQLRSGVRIRLSAGFGMPLAFGRILPRSSCFRAARCSLTRCKTSSASIYRYRTGRSCCVSIKRARSRRSTVSNRFCLWRLAWPSGEPIPTHHVLVRSARHRNRRCDRQVLQTSPFSRVPKFAQADRRCDAHGFASASADGQLYDPPDAKGQCVACAPAALACPLYLNINFLDQSCGALVCRAAAQTVAARGSSFHRRAWSRHHCLHHSP